MMVKNITYLPQSKLAIYYQESANLGVSCEAVRGAGQVQGSDMIRIRCGELSRNRLGG